MLAEKNIDVKYHSLFFILFFSATLSAFAQTDEQVERAHVLFENQQQKQALEAYNEILIENSDHFKALWRTSLLYAQIGYRLDDGKRKKEYFRNAKERAVQALELKPKNSYANFAMGIALAQLALAAGARDRVAATHDIKKYGDRALRFDSTNAGAWHLLGRWHFEVANLNFAERLAANVLFGGLPAGASTQKAASNIEEAIELRPGYILYYYDLATVYDELDKEEKAIAACREALEKPILTPADSKTKSDCRELIDSLL